MMFDSGEAQQTGEPLLTVHGADGLSRQFHVGIVCFIGRGPECDVCINAPGVSEVHCVLTRTLSGLVARDCCSATGTIVNGERIQDSLLTDGDEIVVSGYRIHVRIPPDDASPLSDSQAQQELIQQMARRISVLEVKRRGIVKRAWKLRKKALRPASTSGSGTWLVQLEQERERLKVLQHELQTERAKPKSIMNPAGGVSTLVAEWDTQRKRLEAAVTELTARASALESENAALKRGGGGGGQGDSTEAALLRRENERLQLELSQYAQAAEQLQAMGGLQQYEQQLNEFRDQLSADAERVQQVEAELAQREDQVRSAEEQLQDRIAATEKELAGERAKIKREQGLLERAASDFRLDLEEMQREAEVLERDEKLQRLKTQIRADATGKTQEAGKLSDRIQRFLKGFGNR